MKSRLLVLSFAVFSFASCKPEEPGTDAGTKECSTATDCPATGNECLLPACNDNRCATTPVAQGTRVSSQTAGDCLVAQCDGAGNRISVNDATDVQDDGNECTVDACGATGPTHSNTAAGAACGTGGALKCDGNGACVGCLTANDCPGADSECQTRTCTAGVCGVANTAAGTVTNVQTAGDCQQVQCDGQGGTTTVALATDVRDDGNACTEDTCNGTTPVNAPTMAGSACSAGGTVCDGAGACVACNVAADCAGTSTFCRAVTCTAHQCGFANTPANTALPAQTAGDCRRAVCDGNGAETTANDDADVQNDNNACTTDTCASGAPVHTPVMTGTSCGANLVCNGSAQCVGCVTANDCPGSDTECRTRTCTAGTCGFNFATAGTALTAQTAGDCRRAVCDGTGNVTSSTDNADVPVDGNQCTNDVCTAGAPSNPPASSGAMCNQNGGAQCNGAGACVQCLVNADCGATTECAAPTCNAGVCSTTFTPAGTAVTTQTAGDCQRTVCNGTGGTTQQNDNIDLPVDGNQCTSDVCTAGVPSNPPASSGATCSQNGGAVCNGSGACVQCVTAATCPGVDNECQTRTCTAGACGLSFVASGTAVTTQTAGDCQRTVCNGTGGTTQQNDNADLPIDGNQCTSDVCTVGVPSNPPVSSGATCSQNGGAVCDGSGACVQCVTAATCPGVDNECQTRTCTAGTCGFTFVASGTAVTTQTAGDCRRTVCNGTGGTTQQNDNIDLPVDGNQCTQDVCTAGVPSNPPVNSGATCSQNGGAVCNGSGACVQCVTAATCPGVDDECQARTCTAGVCGMSFTPSGTAIATQSAGDCQRVVCNGSGGTASQADNADVPVDGNQCTSDVCTAGVPSNPPAAAGTTCGAGGVCNGSGSCQECVTAATCPGTDTECQVRTCVAGACGVSFMPSGTALAAQSAGDCQRAVCNGSGGTTSQADDADVPVDGNQCTQDVCTAGVPSNPAVVLGGTCSQNGGTVCNGTGVCVQCNAAADCAGTSNECATTTCTANTCGVSWVASGTPIAAQTAGDCRQTQCNGSGGTTLAVDDSDLPVDGNQCTQDVCSAGTPSNPAVASGGACAQNGGTVCNGAGTCVQCNVTADCPGASSECSTVSCSSNTCGTTFVAAGTVMTSQTAGDCRQNQCDGSGGTTSAVLDSDVPVDGLQCTNDVCTSGTPSNPPAATSTTCSQNGGSYCNGAGACVQCTQASQCASLVCTSNVCQAPTCSDLVKNGAETDVDCGGGTCAGCGVTKACAVAADCLSGVCSSLVCAPPTVVATSPANGAVDVLTTSKVSFTLSANLQAASVSVQAASGACSGSLQVSADDFTTCLGISGVTVSGATATATMASALGYSSRYKVRVTSAVTSTSGEAATAFTTSIGFRTVSTQTSCQVVISQVYGGGGLAGAPYLNDFVELKNQGTTAVSLNNWSIQYASATGTSWSATTLSGSIAPGGYYLVQLASGGSVGAALPTADRTGTVNMSGTAGKVLLASTTSALSGSCPTANVVDFIGYGTTANCSETAVAPAPSNTTADIRANVGCRESNNNSTDFAVGTPTPRNSAAAVANGAFICGSCGVQNGMGTSSEADYCNLQFPTSITATAGTTTPTIYGRIYESGVTSATAVGAVANLIAQVGYGPNGVDPRTQSGWLFFPATFNTEYGNDDEYQGSFIAPAAGSYRYTFRFSLDNGVTWTYGDLDGAGSNAGLSFDLAQLPALTTN
ncbi:MAG: lamin tail domain-containing protein [Myxococcota bacterium]